MIISENFPGTGLENFTYFRRSKKEQVYLVPKFREVRFPFRANRFGYRVQVFLIYGKRILFRATFDLSLIAPGPRLRTLLRFGFIVQFEQTGGRSRGLASSDAWERRGSDRMLVIVR